MTYMVDYEEYKFMIFDYQKRFGTNNVKLALQSSHDFRDELDCYLRYCGDIAASLADVYGEADSEGCELVGEQVRIPRAFVDRWDRYREEIHLDPRASELKAKGVPQALFHPLRQIVTEMLLGANPAFMAYGGFTHMAVPILESFGTEFQKAAYLPFLKSRKWDACFCVTEENAGSDLANIQTEGVPVDLSGCFAITGSKAFITAGMHGLTENTLYIVIGRSSKGQGLTCFLVPRLWPNPNGTLSDNFVRCSKVDEKMGLRGCANTHLTFGEAGRTLGSALGDRAGVGLAQVAPLMAQARLTTALFGVAIAARAYRTALNFASTRKQGRRLAERDSTTPQIAIIHHTDVQRMLLEMKAKVEAFRGMIAAANGHLSLLDYSSDSVSAHSVSRARNLSRFYVPILKAYISDQAWRVCELAIQVHGGRGFLAEHEVEQCARDVKILSLWEGTNYIQSLDLIADKLRYGLNSQIWRTFKEDFKSFLTLSNDYSELNAEFKALDRAYQNVVTLVDTIQYVIEKHGYDAIGQFATRYLVCIGEICAARALLEAACVAHEQMQCCQPCEDNSAVNRRAYLNGKIKSCRFFIFNLLPYTETTTQIISNTVNSFITITESELFVASPGRAGPLATKIHDQVHIDVIQNI